MKRIWYSHQTVSLLCFVALLGCRNSANENNDVLNQLNEGFVQSNQLLLANTADILQAWQDKANDPKTAEKAKFHQPKAKAIHALSNAMLKYIDSLKSLRPNTQDNNTAIPLYTKLSGFKQASLAIDERMSGEVSPSFVLIGKEMDSAENAREKLAQLISHLSSTERNVYLTRIQTNVIIAEQRMLKALFDQVVYAPIHYDEFFEAIVGQNAKVLATGGELEITAGIGRFSKHPYPTITVAGEKVPLNEKGFVTYKATVPRESGLYSIPVKFQFTDQDGNVQTRTISVEYKTVSAYIK